MSLLETHFEKKLTAKLDFDQSAPLINTEIVNDQITQAEFNKIWLELKNSSDNYHQRVRRMFRICVVMSCILLVLAFLALLNVIGGKILIFMLLLVQVVATAIIAVLASRKGAEIRPGVLAKINKTDLQPKGLKLDIRTEQIQDYKSQVTTQHLIMDLIVVASVPSFSIEGKNFGFSLEKTHLIDVYTR